MKGEEKQTGVIYGIVDFPFPLLCSADALGQSVRVEIGGHVGKLILPSLPRITSRSDVPSLPNLLGPLCTRGWERAEKKLYWGRVVSHPSNDSYVDLALLEFKFSERNAHVTAREIYSAVDSWLEHFGNFVTVLTKQNTYNYVSVDGSPDRVELFASFDSEFVSIPRSQKRVIKVELLDDDIALHLSQLRDASRLASKGYVLKLEYELLLEAYKARRNNDYRKAIIEAANAIEAGLTTRIHEEFRRQKINFGKKLLNKYRMLGGRFELSRILGISLPDKDYEKLIIEPRNDVVHSRSFPTKLTARKAVDESASLLSILVPKFYTDKVEQ